MSFDPSTLLAALAGGLAVLAAWELVGGVRRLGPWLTRTLEPIRRAGDEGYEPTGDERARLVAVAVILAAMVGGAMAGWPLGAGVAVLAPAGVMWGIGARRARYRGALAVAVPELATALAEPLRAGRSARAAVIEAAVALEGPMRRELERAGAALELGEPLAKALGGLRSRARISSVDALCASLASRRLAAEDLVVLLGRLGEAAAERERVVAEARTATAQARLTGLLVIAMPAGAAMLAELLSPGFAARVLAAPGGELLVISAAGLMVAGWAMIRRLARRCQAPVPGGEG